MNRKKFMHFVAALILGGGVSFLMRGSSLSPEAQRLMGVLIGIMYIWVSGCMNLAASCLWLLIMGTFAVVDYTGTAEGGLTMSKGLALMLSSFSSTTPATVICGTALAAVVKSSGLAERLVYRIMKLVCGKNGKASAAKLLAAIFATDVPASIMIPSATGRCALYMSIAEGFEGPFQFDAAENGKRNPYQKAVWIAVALIPIIMGGAFLTGAEATIMVGGLIKDATGIEQGWGATFAVLWFPAILVMILSCFVLLKLFPSNIKEVELAFIDEKLKTLGKMTYKENYCLVTLVAMVLLFVTDSIHKIPATLVLFVIAGALFIPGIGPGNWKTEGKKISWDGFFIIAVAMGFSKALTQFGVMAYMADKIQILGINSYFMATLVMIIATLIIRFGIASITSAATLLVPISMIVGQAAGLAAMEVVVLAWVTYVFCRLSFFMPYQGAQLIMTYGMGYYTKEDLLKTAAIITAGAMVIYLAWSFIAPGILEIMI